MRTPAALVLALSCAVPAATAATPARSLVQAHREADHLDPVHHLSEAGRALDRAWTRARPDERPVLDKLRTDFAALALAFSQIQSRTAPDALPQSPTESATTGAVPRAAPGEPTESGPTVPPGIVGAIPQPATSSKRPAEWQVKYADVDRDLKALAPAGDRALANRLGHFRTHLQMFYASALGRSPQR